MTATAINTKTTPTAEAIQEALAFLKNLSEKKTSEGTAGGSENTESLFNSDVFKTIEAALKGIAEAKTDASTGKDAPNENVDGEGAAPGKENAARFTRSDSEDEDEDDEEEDEDEEEDDDDYEEDNDGWDIGDVLAIGAGVALGAAVVYGGIKLGKAIFSD